MIVTIDGPASSGKSTAARGLAQRLQFQFLDTGAMYRVVALACLQRSIDVTNTNAVAEVAEQVEITFPDGRVFAAGIDVTNAIRTPKITQAASLVATNTNVRRELVCQQRKLAEGLNIVTEGRDQGTVAFPEAECKFYLTADSQVRAHRRQRDLNSNKQNVSLKEVITQLQARDQRDKNRFDSPLKPAEDAVQIDTTQLKPAEVLDVLESTIRQRLAD